MKNWIKAFYYSISTVIVLAGLIIFLVFTGGYGLAGILAFVFIGGLIFLFKTNLDIDDKNKRPWVKENPAPRIRDQRS